MERRRCLGIRPKVAGCRLRGYHRPPTLPSFFKELGSGQPAAVVIDLARAPSHGREIAIVIRQRRSTRHLPLIFVGGEADKVARIRALLPDATYASWRGIAGALKWAIARPPEAPITHDSVFAAYAGIPLTKKLGIREGATVALVNAPRGFQAALGDLPEGVRLRVGRRDTADLTVWFVKRTGELATAVEAFASGSGSGPV
jgi:CheY-like chemotaxis protein